MDGFFRDNLGTIIVALILLAVISLIVLRLIRNKKQGKRACSCGCSSCPMRNQCHADAEKTKK